MRPAGSHFTQPVRLAWTWSSGPAPSYGPAFRLTRMPTTASRSHLRHCS